MTAKYPMLLEPVVQERVWGGRWLAEKLGRTGTEGARLGESWEAFSGSLIANGAWQGRSLGELFVELGMEWAGEAASHWPQFPLLVKFIDARENLSVQVHPNDDLAQQLENYPFGKTEFWYVLAAAPDAHVYYGLNAPDISHDDLKAALDRQDLLRYLHCAPVQAGDVLFLPAGTVHALTAGVVVYELQQDSDITYRLYDWERSGREIHLEKGLAAIDRNCANMQITHPPLREAGDHAAAELVACAFFRAELRRVPISMRVGATAHSLTLLSVVSGSGLLASPEQAFSSLLLETGATLCIPAGLAYALHATADTDAPLEVILSSLHHRPPETDCFS